jgi:hypothetical protein
VPKHEIPSNILNSAIHEGLFNPPTRHYVCWRRTIKDHLLFDKKALSGINGGLGLDHVVRKNGPSILQILKLVSGLQRGGATFGTIIGVSSYFNEKRTDTNKRT